MSGMDIYYFSGTGNSLHIAKEIKKRIPDASLIPIVSLINKHLKVKDQETIKTSKEVVGFVFPIHLMTFPTPVKKFIEKLDIDKTSWQTLVNLEFFYLNSTFLGT